MCKLFIEKLHILCTYFFIIDKLLEMNDSMHKLMHEKRQLIASLLQIPHGDYKNVAEVCNVHCSCCTFITVYIYLRHKNPLIIQTTVQCTSRRYIHV